MPALFDKLGIRFQYPENWTLETGGEIDDEGATVFSPGGAFWSIVIRGVEDDPAEVADLALDALNVEYEDLDSEAVEEEVAGQVLVGHDVNFYCLDLTNTAQIRAFRRDRTYLILCQAEDREYDAVAPVFRAITVSLLAGR